MADIAPGRIVLEKRNSFILYTANGEIECTLVGRLFYKAKNKLDLPVSGDWVAFDTKRNTIIKILPRLSLLYRAASGSRKKIHSQKVKVQLLSANIDTVFVVCGLDNDYNLRRIERYITLVRKSGARSVIILNKSDRCSDISARVKEVKKVSAKSPIIAVCALHKNSLIPLHTYLTVGNTCVLIGSSGAGKSTMINTLLGHDRQKVQTMNNLSKKGRHTTSKRELIFMPQGGMIIDTPGLRELQVIGEIDDVAKSFPDIEQFAQQCRFSDCNHIHEPQCAVKTAVQKGILDIERLRNYQKLKSELLNYSS